MYGNDKTKFVEVAGPGHFNDPDEVNTCTRSKEKQLSVSLYLMVQSMCCVFMQSLLLKSNEA